MLSDTDPRAKAIQLELLRQAPVWRRLELMFQLNQMVRTLALNDLRQRFPDATEAELKRRLADRLLGPELAEKVYGPSPRSGASMDE